MYRIAIIEDDAAFAARMINDINQIAKEIGKIFDISSFGSIEDFLLPRQDGFDIVFFDIELPGMDGMEGAKRFRLTDTDAIIIFVTSLANYAVNGYEVGALDYMVKPISYNNLSLKVQKAVKKADNKKYKTIVFHSRKNGILKLRSDEVYYMEIQGHNLSVHTEIGMFETTGNLSVFEEELKSHFFSRCNSCYLVNMRAISRIDDMTVYLKNGDSLAISRRKKKDFLAEFAQYAGQ